MQDFRPTDEPDEDMDQGAYYPERLLKDTRVLDAARELTRALRPRAAGASTGQALRTGCTSCPRP